jgi:hypothetical protein
MQHGLWAPQEARANLNRARAEHQRRRGATAVGNTARGNDQNFDRIDDRRHERHQPYQPPLRFRSLETSAVTSCFHSLRDDNIRSCCLGGTCFGDRRNVREPINARLFQLARKFWRIKTHQRGYNQGLDRQKRFALRVKIWRRRIAGIWRNRRPPFCKKRSDLIFVLRIATRWRIGVGSVEIASDEKPCDPGSNGWRLSISIHYRVKRSISFQTD